VVLHVGEPVFDRLVVGGDDLPLDLRASQRIEDRHRLRGAEGEVVRAHLVGTGRRPTERPIRVRRISEADELAELTILDRPPQLKGLGAATKPGALGLTAESVVVLPRVGDGLLVVVGHLLVELADAQH
jgi:hypothetical protein